MDLLGYIAVLRRRWLIIALCLIAGGAGGFELGHHGPKQYSATSQCLVNIPTANNLAFQLAGAQLSSGLVTTYATLAGSSTVAAKVAHDLQLPAGSGLNGGSLSATSETGSYLIDITATDTSPTQAQALANAAATALSDTVKRLETGVSNRVSVQVVNTAALPTTPIRPRPKLDLSLGLIFGLLAGLLLAAMLEALDRTAKSTSQLDAILEAPLLGLVPKRRRGNQLAFRPGADSPDGEAYRSLRTAVRFLDPDRPLRTLLITSPTSSEGKTSTAANLAVALALSGERVVIVDADLRRGRLGDCFGLDSAVGLTSVVLGKASIDDGLQQWGRNLKVLASGPRPPNPSEILGSEAMNSVLRKLAGRSDIVIIDAPPVLPVADAVALGAQVDGVVLVIRHGKTLRHAASDTRRRLEAAGSRIVGYVLNGAPKREIRTYYSDDRFGYSPQIPGPNDPAVLAELPDVAATVRLRRSPPSEVATETAGRGE